MKRFTAQPAQSQTTVYPVFHFVMDEFGMFKEKQLTCIHKSLESAETYIAWAEQANPDITLYASSWGVLDIVAQPNHPVLQFVVDDWTAQDEPEDEFGTNDLWTPLEAWGDQAIHDTDDPWFG